MAALSFCVGFVGCEGCDGPRRNLPAHAPTPTTSAVAPPAPFLGRTLSDLVQRLPRCDVDHRGPLLDAGSDAMVGRFGWDVGRPSGTLSVEHDGSTWARLRDRRLTVSFSLTEASPIFVSARAIGYGARAAAVSLDDQPLGTLSLARDQIRVATTATTTLSADPGLHMLSFHFFGRSRDSDALADIDWIRVGIPDESAITYGPPTLQDLVAPRAALGGVPHRSLALRAPGAVRCALRLPRLVELRTSVGVQGAGEGEAQIRILRDKKEPVVLRTVQLTGGEQAAWTDIELPLNDFASELVSLELAATQAPPGGRVLFGDPVIAQPLLPPPPAPPARAVVIVVLDGVSRAELPPWRGGPALDLPALSELAVSATTFERHRGPTTVISAMMASLLTGLPPPAHRLTDPGARLPASVTTIARVARDAGVRAAMFTGVPASFRAFGFDSGWERFVEHSPVSGDPATAPIDSAAAWVSELGRTGVEGKLLVVAHTRGGHPPWDVTSKELSTAPPTDYTGIIEPRRGAQIVAKMRKSRLADAATDADRQRIRALAQIALEGQDKALAALIAALRTANLWDSTLFVVTGDVASGAGDLFAESADLELKEPALTLPLYVHFPGGLYGGKRVAEPTEVVDITRTSLDALGLAFSKERYGRDLSRLGSGIEEVFGGPQIALLGDRYSARWGDLVLLGRFGAAPQLCDLGIDPTCAFNRREAQPIAVSGIFRSVAAAELSTHNPAEPREPATIDPDTAAALKVWGATD